jgi:hypothetical protein
MKFLKSRLASLTLVLMFAGGAFASAEYCVKYAQACYAFCTISAPEGGSIRCFSGYNFAACYAYNANGDLIAWSEDECFPDC